MEKPENKIKNKTITIIFLFLFGFFFQLFLLPNVAQAASIFLSASAKTVSVGDIVNVSVWVNSEGIAINDVEAILNFPNDILEALSLSKTNSIFSLWVENPNFSNTNGTVNFNGGLPSPGFNGSSGRIFNIVFRAKKAGTASLFLSSNLVLADDGQGTNVFSSSGKLNLTIRAVSEVAVPQNAISVLPNELPSAPLVTSPTHPDPNEWYSNNKPVFNWKVPEEVTAVRVQYDKLQNSNPKDTFSPAISSKELENLADGVYYFHAQFKNSKGWGKISHFRFQIDTTPPEKFEIKIVKGENFITARPTVLFNTIDNLSGIDHYDVKIGEDSFLILNENQVKNNPYTFPPQSPGKKILIIKAIDRAGNYTEAEKDLVINEVPAPSVTYFSKVLNNINEKFTVRGISEPYSEVSVWFYKKDGELERFPVETDGNGNFTYIHEKQLSDGSYYFWLLVTTSDGSKSSPTEKYSVEVINNLFMYIINNISSYSWFVWSFICLMVLIFSVILSFFWRYLFIRIVRRAENRRKIFPLPRKRGKPNDTFPSI